MEAELTAERHPHHMGAKGRDLSNPRKLGFLRLVEIGCILNVVTTLVYLGMVSRDVMVYDFNTLVGAVTVVLNGVGVWLIMQRMRAARPYFVFLNLFSVATDVALAAVSGGNLLGQWPSWILDGLIILYMLTSRRVKAVLVEPLSLAATHDTAIPKPNELRFWRDLVMFYCIFSVVGHWMEAAFGVAILNGLVPGDVNPADTSLWRDWLYPFPTEGMGFAMCVLILYPIKNWLQAHVHVPVLPIVLSFVINGIVCSLVELVFGLATNPTLQLWDYTPLPFNFMGQICLQNGALFGVVSTIITWVIYPFIARWIDRIPKDAMNIIAVVIYVFYAMLQFLYITNF
jgi:uncharacterized membrane protein